MKRFALCFLIILMFGYSVPVGALQTSAKAAVVINGDTAEVIYSHNKDLILPMASTTKIMSALILAEQNTPDKKIVTTKEMVTVEGSSMGLLEGDTVSYNDLLYGMLLASGNDAANTTAISVAGSVDKFVDMMNLKAQEMGLKNTSFVTPSGLDAEGHHTTAYELSLIARQALKNKDFAKAAASKTATLCYGNPPYKRTLSNHNRLLSSFDGLIGVKTGFTKKSGRCLVTAAERNGKYVIAVTLNDQNDWEDHKRMLEFGLSSIETVVCEPPTLETLKIIGGEVGSVELCTEAIENGVCQKGNIKCRVELPQFIYAPIEKDTAVGNVYFYMDDTAVASSDIVVKNSVKEIKNDTVSRFSDCFLNILSVF